MKTLSFRIILWLVCAMGITQMLHGATSSVSVGRIPGTFSKTPSGGAVYTVPIECPAGIRGMQPSLSLDYNSQSGNGLAGWGWNLSGLSSIMRMPKTKYYDNKEEALSWTNEDPLSLNGSRMMPVERWGQDSVEYRLENDPSVMVRGYIIQGWGAVYFKVYTKEGLIMVYGDPDQLKTAYINVTGYASDKEKFKRLGWQLIEVADRNGNFMKIDYWDDSNLIKEIVYGGNKNKGTAGNLSVSFGYASRKDKMNHFILGYLNMLERRLFSITTKVDGVVQKEYRLTYQEGYISHLASLELYDRGVKQYDPLVFVYGEEDRPKSHTDISFVKKDASGKEKDLAALIAVDLDGDGYSELGDMYNREFPPNSGFGLFGDCQTDIRKRSEKGVWEKTTTFTTAVNMGNIARCIPSLFGDFNGDGALDDVLFFFERGVRDTTLIATVWDRTSGGKPLGNVRLRPVKETPFVAVGCYWGRPLSDILVIYDNPETVSGGYRYRYDLVISQFNGYLDFYNKDMFIVMPSKIKYVTTVKTGSESYYDDMWLILEDGTTHIVKNNQSSMDCFSNSKVINTKLNIGKDDVFAFGDLNGDGFLDVVFLAYRNGYSEWYAGLNMGEGVYSRPQRLSGIGGRHDGFEGESDRVMLVDINNDNLLDLVMGDEKNDTLTRWSIHLNRGVYDIGMFAFHSSEDSPERAAYSCFADFLGTGTVSWAHMTMDKKVVITDFGFGRNKNLLVKVENPLSTPLELKYKPQAECRFLDWSKSKFKEYVSVGYVPYKTTMIPVLSESYDGLMRMKYDYGVPLVNWSHRGYLGFLNQKEYDVTNNIRTETFSGIMRSGMLYNVVQPYEVNKYLGETSTTSFFQDKTFHSIRSLGGKRFVVQPYDRLYTDNVGNELYLEKYVWDEYNNMVKYTKDSRLRNSVTESVYEQYGSWCPNVVTKETVTETCGSDVLTKVRTSTYNNLGNRTKYNTDSETRDAMTLSFGYDEFGNNRNILRKSKFYRSSFYNYSASGRFLIGETDELGEKVTKEWDEQRGLLLKETDRIGTTTYTYDAFGDLITTTYPNGTKKDQSKSWTSSGVPGSKYMTTVSAEGTSPVWSWYDSYGREMLRKMKGVNDKDIYTYTEYRNDGKINRVSKPTYNTAPTSEDWASTYEYDSYGRVIKVTTPQGVTTTGYGRSMDDNGYYHLLKTVTTPDSKTQSDYSEEGFLLRSTVNGKSVKFTYTVGGKIKKATPEGGIPVEFQYDRDGNRTQITDPSVGIISSKFDGWGQLIEETQGIHNTSAPQIVSYTYQANGLLSKRTRGSVITTYSYDSEKRLSRVYNSESEKTFKYDEYDRVTETSGKINGRTLTSKKEYDVYGRITKEIYPSGYFINNVYDVYGNLVSVTDAASKPIWQLLTCDAEGRVLSEKKGTEVTTYSYNLAGRLDSIVCPNVVSMHYQYAVSGNLQSYEDKMSGQRMNYTYDTMDRLVKWRTLKDSYPFNNVDYDSQNRITRTFNMQNYGCDYTYTNKDRPYAVSSTNRSFVFPYQRITYTDFKKVESIIHNNDTMYTFSYGPDEERMYMRAISKTNSPFLERYYAENYEEDSHSEFGTVHYIHGANGLAAVYIVGRYSTVYNVYTELQGSLVALTSGGRVVERYAYDPWGNRLDPQNWDKKDARERRILYRGYTMHEHLDGIGLINMNARLYDPNTYQFLSPDPQLQTPGNWLNYNRYNYCLNNPLKYTDPDGEFFHFIIGAVLGGVVNWALHGFRFDAKGLGYFGVGALAGAFTAGVASGISSAINMVGSPFWGGFVSGSVVQSGTSSFLSGALVGGGAGFAGGFTNGLGNGLMDGMSFDKAFKKGMWEGTMGGLSGGLVGGLAGGIDAALDGRRFWDGAKVNDIELLDRNFPYVAPKGDHDCVGANIESISRGSITQEEVRAAFTSRTDVGLNDLAAYQKFEGRLGRNVFYIPPESQSKYNMLSKLLEGYDVSVNLNTGNSLEGHLVTINRVVQRTVTKVSGKVVNKLLYYTMYPGRGAYYKLPIEVIKNNYNIFSIKP